MGISPKPQPGSAKKGQKRTSSQKSQQKGSVSMCTCVSAFVRLHQELLKNTTALTLCVHACARVCAIVQALP